MKEHKLSLSGELSAMLGEDSPRVLLHACCAPCSGAIVEALLQEGIVPTLFFSNSNIVPREEYEHRMQECIRYCEGLGVPFVQDEYDHSCWREFVRGHEKDPERGDRCLLCFTFRLRRAALWASLHSFNVLSTTLASSRWKDLGQVDAAGEDACSGYPSLCWWGRNWRKGGLQQRRGEIIREQGFYNQLYCGCEFSLASSPAMQSRDGTCPLPETTTHER